LFATGGTGLQVALTGREQHAGYELFGQGGGGRGYLGNMMTEADVENLLGGDLQPHTYSGQFHRDRKSFETNGPTPQPTQACILIQVHVKVFVHTHTHTYTCIFIHIHTYKYIYVCV